MNLVSKRGARRVKGSETGEIEFGDLSVLTGYAIKRAQERVFETFMEATPDKNITPARFAALSIIAANERLTQSELADVLRIARSGVAAMLRVLQDIGYVSQAAAEGDRRAVQLALTPAGRIALEAVTAAIRVQDDVLTAGFDEVERETLLKLLKRISP